MAAQKFIGNFVLPGARKCGLDPPVSGRRTVSLKPVGDARRQANQ
jgi:hypothetical protein